MSEEWLKGNFRVGKLVMRGAATHCAGCGTFNGMAAVVLEDGWTMPPEPDWPFDAAKCPVCGDGFEKKLRSPSGRDR